MSEVKAATYIDDEYPEGSDVAEEVSDSLRHRRVDNGIGPYEYHGQKCYDRQPSIEIVDDEVVVEFARDVKALPVAGEATYRTEDGVCDFRIDLIAVEAKRGGNLIARYSIEQLNG